jgi:peptide/nickel transport system permease protein
MRPAALPSRRLRVSPLVGYAGRRVLTGIVLALLVSVLVFLGTQVLPGDAATAILGRNATPAQVHEVRSELGLDRSVPEQYWTWLSGFVTGQFGDSYAADESVAAFIGERVVNSLILALTAILVLVPISLLLGVWAGIRRDRPVDHVISTSTLALIALPEFVTGTLLAIIFAVSLNWLPAVSLVAPGHSPLETPSVLVLPVAALLLAGLAYTVRMLRAGVIEALSAEYVQMARLNGVPERRLIWRYVLPAALAPTVQVLALTLQWLVGGVVVVESVFAYPGIGQGLVDAVIARDVPVVQSIAMLIALLYIAVNIVADLAVVLLIPKLRTAG